MYESVVVGASVVGGVCAKELSQRGVRTLLLSDKVGKDGKCTSIVSKRGLDKTDIRYEDAVLHEIHGARIWAGPARLNVRTPQVQALVLNRFALDRLSVEQAQDAGVELQIDRFKDFDGRTLNGGVETRVLIGADGVASTVAKNQGFTPLEKIVVAWEAEFENASLEDPCLVDVFLGFPGLFAWAVPCGNTSLRVGLAVNNGRLDACKARLFSFPYLHSILRKASQTRSFCHSIPLHYRRQTQKKNVLLVGDAAGQVKATTGGGIVFGSLCAKEAAAQTKVFLDGGSLAYEKAWRGKYARTLDVHYALRKILDTLPFTFTSLGVHTLSALRFNRFLEKHGDMDFIVHKG